MKNTGIVRRVDELGRVVIPKEMRKTLRIKEGDPLEIYTERGELLLKKYSPIATIAEEAELFVNSLAAVSETACLACDTDSILCSSSGRYKDYVGKQISSELEKCLKERRNVFINRTEGKDIISLVRGEPLKAEGEIVVPIVDDGDLSGGIIMLSSSRSLDNADYKLAMLGADYLANK